MSEPPPTCFQCSEVDTLREMSQTIGRMEGTLNAVLAQATKTNSSVANLYERSNTHRGRLDLHGGRIEELEGGIKATKKRWEKWADRGWKLLVAVFLAMLAYWNFGN